MTGRHGEYGENGVIHFLFFETKVMLEQSMAPMELKKAVINYETSPAPTHWARFGDCRNQLVAKYIGTGVYSVIYCIVMLLSIIYCIIMLLSII